MNFLVNIARWQHQYALKTNRQDWNRALILAALVLFQVGCGLSEEGQQGTATDLNGQGTSEEATPSSNEPSPGQNTSGSPTPTSSGTTGLATSFLTWQLQWDLSGVEVGDAGLTMTSDLGYQITITEGWLVTYNLSLCACSSSYYRGALHSCFDSLSQLTVPQPSPVESLSNPINWVANLEIAPAQYCQADWLLARADVSLEPLPEGADVMGLSLLIKGTWMSNQSDSPIPFALESDLQQERTVDLPSGEAERLQVTVTRNLAHAFDAVELATLDPVVAARDVLENIARNTTFDLHLLESSVSEP